MYMLCMYICAMYTYVCMNVDRYVKAQLHDHRMLLCAFQLQQTVQMARYV